MAKLQISIRKWLILLTAFAFFLACFIELNGRIDDVIANGYRVQTVGDLLVDYLDDCGKWPANWDDLDKCVEAHRSRFQHVPRIHELQANVRIDFDFDPYGVDLHSEWSDEKPAFTVVRSKYGRTSGATRNPNQFIYEYLRGDVPQSMLFMNKKLIMGGTLRREPF